MPFPYFEKKQVLRFINIYLLKVYIHPIDHRLLTGGSMGFTKISKVKYLTGTLFKPLYMDSRVYKWYPLTLWGSVEFF